MNSRTKFDCSYRTQVDPFQTGDGRWLHAEHLITHGGSPTPLDDELVHLAFAFQLHLVHGGDKDSAAGFKDISKAKRVYENNNAHQWEIQARLIAGETYEAIEDKTGVPADTLLMFHRVFFDVPMNRSGTDWILTRVIGIGPWGPAEPTLKQIWTYAALAGGPFLVDLLTADYFDRSEPAIPNRRLLAEQAEVCVRMFCVPLHDREASARLVRDAERVFDIDRMGQTSSQSLPVHFDTLRMAAGMPPRNHQANQDRPQQEAGARDNTKKAPMAKEIKKEGPNANQRSV